MHQIVLLTAMTATSGLFGGGRHCPNGQCAQARWAPFAHQPRVVSYAPPAPTYVPQAVPQAAYVYPTTPAYPCPNGTCPRR